MLRFTFLFKTTKIKYTYLLEIMVLNDNPIFNSLLYMYICIYDNSN